MRLFNVVGPGETNPHLLPEMIAQLKAGRTGISVGNLSPKRDYIHVKDAASGFAAASLDGATTRRISTDGGFAPMWSRDGRTLYYRGVAGLNGEGDIMAVDVSGLPATLGKPVTVAKALPAVRAAPSILDTMSAPTGAC